MIWTALGWLGNACFFGRFLVQWLLSERARRSVVPPLFWHLSISGAACLALYSVEQAEGALAAGAVVNGAIALRNLQLGRGRPPARRPGLAGGLLLLVALGIALLSAARSAEGEGWDPRSAWGAVALTGQVLWSSRFALQWWCSERAGRSHFPGSFWWVSLAGNALLLAYALHLADAVYVAGFAVGPLVQVRNLLLQRRAQGSPPTARAAALKPRLPAPRGAPAR